MIDHAREWTEVAGAWKGSTTARNGPRSDEQPAEVLGEVRSEIGPQNGVHGLGDAIRRYARLFPNASPVVSGTLDAWAATADALEAERDDWKRKAEKPLINHRRCEASQEQVTRVRALLDRPLIPSALLLAALDGEEL